MAVLEAQTREEIAVAVGDNMDAVHTGTLTDAGTASTFNDDSLPDSDNKYNGDWFRGTSGTNDEEIRPISNYVGSTTIGTTRGDDLPASTADGDTYEIWAKDLPPERVHRNINRAIRTVTRKGAPPFTEESLHASRQVSSYAPTSTMIGVKSVQYRETFSYATVHNCDSVWDELVDTDTTATLDTENYRQGNGSNKFVVAAGMAAGDIVASENITSDDYSGFTHIEFWFYTTVTTTAGQISLRLSSTASAATATEEIAVPATTALTWTWHRVALANPQSDTAIISVGLIYTSDIGAVTMNVDGIIVTRDLQGDWATLSRRFWYVDKDQREIRFTSEGVDIVGYAWLRMIGRKKPTELNADATECDIDPEFIIAKATALTMRATSDRHAGSRDGAGVNATEWDAIAADLKANMLHPPGIRWLDQA
tara:strand:+ start:9239 stop:10510 length:1272 start_codon:yes stop_codon:yes gene_type:complete